MNTAEKMEITIDSNCAAAPAKRKRNALNDAEQRNLDAVKADGPAAWAQYDRVVVAFSGGKDSLAAVLQLLELGCPREKMILWHHEIDGRENLEAFMDWPVTPDYCRAVADELGLPLRFSWKQGGFKGEMLRDNVPTAPTSFETEDGEVLTTGGKGPAGTRMKWPAVQADLKVRWCSAYLKIDVATTAFRNDPAYKEGGRYMIVTGERREESKSRSKYAEAEMHKSTNKKRTVIQWRSVIDWTEAEVWEIIERHSIDPHPCYKAGFGRCSCAFCIFGNPDQFATAADLLPRQFEELVKVEGELGFTMQKDTGLAQHVAKGCSFAKGAPDSVRAACGSTVYKDAVKTDNWELPAGAFRAHGGPL